MVGKIPKKKPREGVDEYGRTKLHYTHDVAEIERLIESGYDIDHQDDNGWTTLHFMAQANNLDAIAMLLRLGANPNLLDLHGNSPLWTATMNAKKEFDCVIALLKAGADAKHRNKHGRSPLDMARTIQHGLDKIFSEYARET